MKKHFDCRIGKRSLANGKALGSHKKVHKRRPGSNELQRIFTCPVCSQVFVSARSVHSHMKKLSGIRRSSRHQKRAANDYTKYTSPMPLSLVIKGKPQYACTVCGLSFKSYQALGGHKTQQHVRMGRLKYTKDGEEECGAIVPYKEKPNQSGGFGFDLNQLPPEWTE